MRLIHSPLLLILSFGFASVTYSCYALQIPQASKLKADQAAITLIKKKKKSSTNACMRKPPPDYCACDGPNPPKICGLTPNSQ